MDLLGHLIGSEGCNVDGTVGANPFTAFVDQAFAGNFGSDAFGFTEDGSSVVFADESTPHEAHQMVLQITGDGEMLHPISQGGGFHNAQFPHAPMMYRPMMHMAQFGPMMQYGQAYNPASMSMNYDERYEENYDEHYEENFDEVQMHEDEIGNSELAANAQVDTEGPSRSGLNQAWSDLQEKLSSGQITGDIVPSKQAEYSFATAEDNPYLQSNNTKNVSDAMEKGMALYREGNVREAILCFESVVQDSTGVECDEAWRMLGVCHAENDEDKRAIYCLNKCLDLDTYNLEALLGLATSYVNELDSVRALETLRTWVAHNPRYQGLDGSALDAYSDGTLMDEVTQLVLTVAAHDPTDIDVKILLGVLYNVSLDYDSAIQCFQEASSMRPEDYSLVNKLAASYANGNMSEMAIPHYSRALQMRPKFARGWLNLGISFANLDRYEDAAKAYVQALNLNPGARHIWNYLRVVLSCMDRFDLVPLTSEENIRQLASSLNVDLLSSS